MAKLDVDIELIGKLADLMEEKGLTELVVEEDENKLRLQRGQHDEHTGNPEQQHAEEHDQYGSRTRNTDRLQAIDDRVAEVGQQGRDEERREYRRQQVDEPTAEHDKRQHEPFLRVGNHARNPRAAAASAAITGRRPVRRDPVSGSDRTKSPAGAQARRPARRCRI